MDHPLISVIIPAYNAGRYLGEALLSVFDQDYKPIEIIVVDDESTDKTATVAKSYAGVIYTCQSNKGPAAARNTGIDMAQGDLIAFLDADDYWPTNKLKIQLSYFIDDPETEVVLGRVQCRGLLTAVEEKIRFEDSDNTMINVNLGSGLFKKSVFEKVGYFDETLSYYEDHDWFLRAREHGISMIILKQVTLYYRIHENSMSWKKQKTDPTMMQILKMSLERRRKQHNGSAPPLKKFFDFDEGRPSREKKWNYV